jgi:hypothetical protein
MGTPWRGLLAPLGVSTGDGRRFKTDGVTHRALPLALKWQRTDTAAHEDSVVIGATEQINFGTVTEAIDAGWISAEAAAGLDAGMLGVWGGGQMFDDVDSDEMPRLAEDVAEARLMLEQGVVGPSVDPGAAEAVLAEVGSDEPLTEERFWELVEQAEAEGREPAVEILFTQYEIAAATLVTVPAFAQCQPFELVSAGPADDDDGDDGDGEASGEAAVTPAPAAQLLSLVAAGAGGGWGAAEHFDNPGLTAVTPITITDPDSRGVRRVYGHVAEFTTCHTGFKGLCVTPPSSARGYSDFHRYLTTASGRELPVPAGRITVAHGALTGACGCCPGIDDHACNQLALGAAIAHYDRAQPVAYVRAYEDDHGIAVAGVIAPETTDADVAALARGKVSGDWREVAGNLELVEVLTLHSAQPGFPLPRTALRNGRQTALVAAGTVRPTPTPARPGATARAAAGIDYDRIGDVLADRLARLLPGALPAGASVTVGGVSVTMAGGTTAPAAATVDPPTGPPAAPATGPLVDEAALRAAVCAELAGEVEAAAAAGHAAAAATLLKELNLNPDLNLEEAAHV